MVHSHCDSNCVKVLDCGHPCSKRCTEPCQCNTYIEADLECGHRRLVLCHMKDNPPRCVKRCKRVLECGHDCPGICHEDCRMKKCESTVYKFLPCSHQQNVPCYIDPQNVFCYAPCQRQLDCGHKCSSVCGCVCQEVQCEELCQKKCERGHACQKRCHFGLSCGDCMVAVNMTPPSCGHDIEMPCHVDPTALRCKRPCERVRACGHPCQDICSTNCEALSCKKLVARTLPCGHVVSLPCHKNPETYDCKKRVEVHLSCGHEKSLVCHVAKAGKENILCNEIVEKELRCKHIIKLPCHKNPAEYDCKEKVHVKLQCGHMKSVICSTVTTDLQNVSCMVKIQRSLPCGHEATLPCYRNPEEYCCQKEVEIILSCTHKKLITCSRVRDGLQDETCDTKVTRKLLCGHEKEMMCSDHPGKVFCDAPCERRLPCEHPCPQKCGEDCASLKCAVTVQKGLACESHKVTCLCSDDVSQVVCANKCNRKLSCGHKCPGKCSENCSQYKCRKMVVKHLGCAGNHSLKMACSGDPNSITCQEQCNRNLECGHLCPGLCSQECESMRCMRRVEKRFPCGHKEPLQCFQSKVATCMAPCRRRKSSCKHICKGYCGEDCSKYPCDVAVNALLRVEQSFNVVTSVLEHVTIVTKWVHINCANIHVVDYSFVRTVVKPHVVSLALLVTGNAVDVALMEDVQNDCSQPCKPCTEPCTWSCPHYQCNNLCGEECDRPRCNAPCPKKLPCRHPCIGLCGENCPTVCAVCHAKKLSPMLADGRGNKATKCVQLFDCCHIIKIEEMDAWMLRELGDDVQLMRCPKCSTSITFNYRYGNIIKRTLTNIENVKTHIQDLVNDVTNSVSVMGKDLNHLKYVTKLKFPSTVLSVVQPFQRTLYRFDLRHVHERGVLFLFTLKNHLTILQQAQRTDQVLRTTRNVRRLQASFQQQLEVDELWNVTTDALEKIKEYLEKPLLNLKTLSQVHEQTRKFFLFAHVLEAQRKAMMHHIPLSSIAENSTEVGSRPVCSVSSG
ncbi:NFX1-type zinc finger-containing protein 1 [Desmophyllum pertusum]|uniref:NFX1-type zinc finger-containing protein 1 n=1 Tax=Desmophyllum pertusum TaxID=174260 RepID=A0A9W9ZNP3_9CNID|nr:NFX1-type zinc finger-containing protein 1 [Desmophyllum pertusum]